MTIRLLIHHLIRAGCELGFHWSSDINVVFVVHIEGPFTHFERPMACLHLAVSRLDETVQCEDIPTMFVPVMAFSAGHQKCVVTTRNPSLRLGHFLEGNVD